MSREKQMRTLSDNSVYFKVLNKFSLRILFQSRMTGQNLTSEENKQTKNKHSCLTQQKYSF